jgi:hypothetical protein
MRAAEQAAAKSSVGNISSAGVSNSSAEAALQSAAAKMGWTGAQWQALYDVEMREAGFNLNATNASSGAYGLAQFINGAGEYAQYGGNAGSASGQATAMVNYVRQRYISPEAAYAHELAYGWYDQGGLLKPGLTLAYNGTGKNEQVVSPAAPAAQQGATLNDVVRALNTVQAQLNKLTAVTGQQGAAFGNSLSASARAGSNAGYYR